MSSHQDERPRHQQIAAAIRASILDGTYPPGSKLPTTAEYQEQFRGPEKVAPNQTIQNALTLLELEGLIYRRKGSGVFVETNVGRTVVPASYLRPAEPNAPYPWVSEAATRGQVGSSRLLAVGTVEPPSFIAAVFAPETIAVLRAQILLLDDDPAELVRSYYPTSIAAGTALEEDRRIPGGSPRLLADLGFPPRQVVDQISARPPTTEELVHLRLPQDVPVIRTFRVVLSHGGRPIEATEMLKAAHRYELEYTINL